MTRFQQPRFLFCGLLFSFLLVPLAGCVERKLQIRSEPPGALVYIDDQLVGETPFEYDYVHYGERIVELRKAGFRAERFAQPLKPPFYQWPVVDFVCEILLPVTIVDERELNRQLRPEDPDPRDPRELEAVLERAEAFRQRTLTE